MQMICRDLNCNAFFVLETFNRDKSWMIEIFCTFLKGLSNCKRDSIIGKNKVWDGTSFVFSILTDTKYNDGGGIQFS